MRTSTVPAPGGGAFEVHSVGEGPGIVVVHGGGVSMALYRRLAHGLSDRFTVHLYNRRGRPHAPPYRAGGYSLEGDIEDLAAILDGTGSRYAFGHSGGGFVALRAALRLPLERVAAYDPAMSVAGSMPTGWLDPFEEAVGRGEIARGMAIMNHAMRTGGPGSGLPVGVQAFVGRAFLRTPIGRGMAELLPATVAEIRAIEACDGPASDYAGITAEVLLTAGGRSPRLFATTCQLLAGAIPRGRYLRLPGYPHNAACVARRRFVRPFAEFFAAPVRTP